MLKKKKSRLECQMANCSDKIKNSHYMPLKKGFQVFMVQLRDSSLLRFTFHLKTHHPKYIKAQQKNKQACPTKSNWEKFARNLLNKHIKAYKWLRHTRI